MLAASAAAGASEDTKASARPGVIVAKVEPWLAVKNLFDNLGKDVPAALGHSRTTVAF
jgi:hypothetical protein